MIDYTVLEDFFGYMKIELEPQGTNNFLYKKFAAATDVIFKQKKYIEKLEYGNKCFDNKIKKHDDQIEVFTKILKSVIDSNNNYIKEIKNPENEMNSFWIEGDYGEVPGTDANLIYSCAHCGFKSIDANKYCGGCGFTMLCVMPERKGDKK